MIKGFSRLSKKEKIKFITDKYLSKESEAEFHKISAGNKEIENILENLSENVINSFHFPFSIVPGFLIDGREYTVPMVTEESSVVAAAAKSAGFWFTRGGFRTEILGTLKKGHVHFFYAGRAEILEQNFPDWKSSILKSIEPIDHKMKARGGGVKSINLINKTSELKDYYQLELGFETCDAMGANYMNSCLEAAAGEFEKIATESSIELEISMAILSNYSPENAVRVYVECPLDELSYEKAGLDGQSFAEKFCKAVEIARTDVYRAVTHNKGFYNGVDAVVLATGNDWRAIEANGHAFASKGGRYKSLSTAYISDGLFHFEATVPMQVGSVGGIIGIHPMTKISMEILGHPSANDLMKVVASVGLATNFAAVKSLVTTGIQKGHMKMHLSNILMELKATEEEKSKALVYFESRKISHSAVEEFIDALRK
ncbi:MAG: hydroxymethylglutaryl-CoA reductase, degradative [Bacteroidales bacterium]|nr:hydroxymethylglutaryl-CoA reductase, degradative [Bacteroidales bacterium]